MAKKKKKLDEELELDDFDAEDLDEVDDFDADIDGDADAEKENQGDAEQEEETPKKQKPAVTMTTLLLCVLNVLAALAFAFLALMDLEKRQQFAYATLLHDVAIQGLPLAEEENTRTASRLLPTAVDLEAEDLSAQFRKRGTSVSVSEKFEPISELIPMRIKPSMLSDSALKDIFKDAGGGQTVRTLEEEVQRLQSTLPGDISAAATKVATEEVKTPQQQRDAIEKLLLPIATTNAQLLTLAQQIAQAQPAELKSMLEEAVQRRMYFDILRQFELYRPWGADISTVLDKAALAKEVPLDQLQSLATSRIGDVVQNISKTGRTQESYEKRENVAFLVALLGELRTTPTGNLLYPSGKNRAETIVGVLEYNRALDTLAHVNNKIFEDYLRRIADDRDGTVFVKGNTAQEIQGFVDQYQKRVSRIMNTVAELERLKYTKARVAEQKARNELLLQTRQKDYQDVLDRLLKVRNDTADLVAELRQLETQLFAAQRELAVVSERNQELEQEIRKLEAELGTVTAQ